MDERLNKRSNVPSEGSGAGKASLQATAQGPSACHRFMFIRSRRGQQVVEYGLLIAAISAALFAMFIYGKRGLQILLRETTASEIGPQLAGSQIVAEETGKSSRALAHTLTGQDSRMNYTRGEVQYELNAWSSSTGISSAESSTVLRDPGSGVDVSSTPSAPTSGGGWGGW